MERYLFVTYTDCADLSREEEFNEWYNNVHVPDMLETPSMISATRWENVYPKGNNRTSPPTWSCARRRASRAPSGPVIVSRSLGEMTA